jgi:hypothetical protein
MNKHLAVDFMWKQVRMQRFKVPIHHDVMELMDVLFISMDLRMSK